MEDSTQAVSCRRPTVSVVIPARNAAATLDETIRSVRAQQHQDWELLLIDDGSTDRTAEIATRWANKDARIRMLPGPQRGVSAARNMGLRLALGDIVAFLDADDLWLPAKLTQHVQALAQHPERGVSFDRVEFMDQGGRPTGVTSTAHVCGLRAHDYLYENPACTASTLVARRHALLEVGGFDEDMRFAEDLELMVRVRLRTTWDVEGLPVILTHYRANPQGASSRIEAMQAGWEQLMARVGQYAPELVEKHLHAARAVHLRYLARRVLRLGLPPRLGLGFFAQAVRNSPWALLRDPRRTFATLAALLLSWAFGPLFSESSSAA